MYLYWIYFMAQIHPTAHTQIYYLVNTPQMSKQKASNVLNSLSVRLSLRFDLLSGHCVSKHKTTRPWAPISLTFKQEKERESKEIQYCNEYYCLSWNIEASGMKSDRMFTNVLIRFLKLSDEGETQNRWIDIHFLISKWEALQRVCMCMR